MHSTKRLLAIGLVSLCWIPTGAVAQGVADKPTMKVGDRWAFQQSVKAMPGGDKSEPWSRRVVEILPNGQVQLAGGDDHLILTDGSLNPIDPKGAEYSLTAFKFPMSVGATWDYSARAGTDMNERRGQYKVAAWEPVTVPAGSFECFRVEGEWQTTGRYVNVRGRGIYWYCPRLNFIAKRQSEFTREIRGQPTVSETRLSELTKFTPAP
jgi:hypothetical protein